MTLSWVGSAQRVPQILKPCLSGLLVMSGVSRAGSRQSPTQWTWVWVNSESWWWTGRPGVLQFMGSKSRTRLSDWTELNWADSSRYLYTGAHKSTIHNSKMVAIMQMSISRWMGRQDVLCPWNRIVFSHKKSWSISICYMWRNLREMLTEKSQAQCPISH